MINLTENNLATLNDYILKDFKDVMPNIEKDIKHTYKFDDDCIFYTWSDDELLGYMGIIRTPEVIFCSYTKMRDRKVFKLIYKKFKEIYKEAEAKDIPIVTDGTNFMHCKNHVEPITINGFELFRWKI